MTDQERKAMKMALESLEDAETNNDCEARWDLHRAATEALRQALAQPEQEHEIRITALEIRVANLEKPLTDHEKQLMAGQRELLRTAPPSKPWVSLNSEELASIVVEHAGFPTRQLAAIEAALRSKNT